MGRPDRRRFAAACALALAWLAMGAPQAVAGPAERTGSLDRFGGWTGVEAPATGRFRVERIDGRWWFITPEGHGLWVNGPTDIYLGTPAQGGGNPHRDAALRKRGSEQGWLANTERRLDELGINSIGGWTPGRLWEGRRPTAVVTDGNAGFYSTAPVVPGWPMGFLNKRVRDYFGDDWPARAAAWAAQNPNVQWCKGNPWCIGIFTDNEQPRGPGYNIVGSHLDAYMTLPAGAPGKRAVQRLLEQRYDDDLAAFNAAWGQDLDRWDDLQDLTRLSACPLIDQDPIADEACWYAEDQRTIDDRIAFEAEVARRYASVADAVLNEIDPEMLVLGEREISTHLAPEVVEATGRYFDVISVNNYAYGPDGRAAWEAGGASKMGYLFRENAYDDLTTIERLTGRPVMVTEFFFRVARPGALLVGRTPGLFPPFLPTVATREQQADEYAAYQRRMMADPAVVGATWYRWVDQPAEGRDLGAGGQDNPATPENQLIGVVDIEDELNQPLADRMREVNADMIALRLGVRTVP